MAFPRAMVARGGDLPHLAMPGDSWLNPAVILPGDGAVTLTVSQMLAGAIYGVVTAGRAYTTPTAAALTAALPDMGVGDTFKFYLISTGGAVTLTGGTGVTVNGGLMVDGVGAVAIVRKDSATAYTIYCF